MILGKWLRNAEFKEGSTRLVARWWNLLIPMLCGAEGEDGEDRRADRGREDMLEWHGLCESASASGSVCRSCSRPRSTVG